MKTIWSFLLPICLATTFGVFNGAQAAVRLLPVFTSNMVLQREMPIRVSGYAAPGEEITVKLGDQIVGKAVGAGPDHVWTVTLPTLKAGHIPDITVQGVNIVVLTNLLAGDVWVCGGQSNMEMALQRGPWCNYGGVLHADQEVAEADHPPIRLFSTAGTNSWAVCSPERVKSFSASGYFFGRELQQRLNVPIGLIQTSIGGTPVEIWIPKTAWPNYAASKKAADPIVKELKPLLDADRQADKDRTATVNQSKLTNTPLPPPAVHKLAAEQVNQVQHALNIYGVGGGFDGRVKPATAIPVKGVIWYQGESNQYWPEEYAERLAWLISGWREAWGQPELPFIIMQLANFEAKTGNWPALRAAQQTATEKIPNTALAVGIDIGEAGNIHPKNKQEVGRRLALAALKQVYGLDVVAAGPRPLEVRFEANQVTVLFDQTVTLQSRGESGFEVAGADGKFAPAQAAASGKTVVVHTASVQQPRSIRYAWRDNPAATLSNSDGLPTAPFQKRLPEYGGENHPCGDCDDHSTN